MTNKGLKNGCFFLLSMYVESGQYNHNREIRFIVIIIHRDLSVECNDDNDDHL